MPASGRRSPPPRSRRCTAPRSNVDGVRKPVAVKVLRPGIERALPGRSRRLLLRRAQGRRAGRSRRSGCAWSRWWRRSRRSVAIEMDFRLEAAALSEMAREHPRGRRLPRAGGRLGPHRARSADAGMDRRHAAQRPRRARGQGLRSAGARPQRDPDFPAPRAARRLLPRRHASGQSVRRRRRPAGRGRLRHHGPARAEGAPLPRRDPVRLHHPRLPAHRAGAFRRRLRAARTIRSRASRRRSAPSASRSTTAPPKTSRWRSC